MNPGLALTLFDGEGLPGIEREPEALAPGAVRLPGFVCRDDTAVLEAVAVVQAAAPPRRMTVPGGRTMSVAMTNCGRLGWVSDASGYRYDGIDPDSGRPWPPMPEVLLALARRAAERAGYADFRPDACLVNRYEPGARLSLHQDRDELDLRAPIVSVSLGLPARFLFGGPRRQDPTRPFALFHGDVVVWGGPSRLYYHGVAPVKDGEHPLLGRCRVNLTFRKVR